MCYATLRPRPVLCAVGISSVGMARDPLRRYPGAIRGWSETAAATQAARSCTRPSEHTIAAVVQPAAGEVHLKESRARPRAAGSWNGGGERAERMELYRIKRRVVVAAMRLTASIAHDTIPEAIVASGARSCN